MSGPVSILQLTLCAKSSSRTLIINLYAPTSTRVANTANEIDVIYSAVSIKYSDFASSTIFFIVGVWNAKGNICKYGEPCIGSHGRGHGNVTGELLIHFCETFSSFLCNTAFQHAARYKTTWTGHQKDKTTSTFVQIDNQIDYHLYKKIHQQLLTVARSYNGGHTTSDHRILVARFKLDKMFGTFSTSNKSKLESFAI